MPSIGVLKSKVAIRLIVGHMIQQIQIDIAYVINCGLSVGFITVKASFLANFPTIKNSNIKAIGTIIGSSCRVTINVVVFTTLVFKTAL